MSDTTAAFRTTRALGALGRLALGVGRDVRAMLALLARTGAALGAVEPRLVVRQAFELANRSAFFVVVVMGCTGAIMVIQACIQARRILGDLTVIGPAFLQLDVREFGPTITALMVAARYGAGVGAELGAMTITEQVDALRMTGATPEGHLVGPRVLGGLVGIVPIVVVGTTSAYVVGGVAGHLGFGIGWDTYFDFTTPLVGLADVATGLCKAITYGVAIPLVACHAGLVARGGAPGVGRATTYAVIAGSTAILMLDLAVGTAAHLLERWW